MKIVYVLVFALLSSGVLAQTISTGEVMIWGIGDNEIVIPTGSVIIDAVLTIAGASYAGNGFYVQLLDDTVPGLSMGVNGSGQNFFDGCGAVLLGQFSGTNYICQFGQNNDPSSPIWSVFSSPCQIDMMDSTTVQLSSSMLLLNDFAGNGRGFGIGIDPGDGALTFRSVALVLTIKNYQGTSLTTKLTYKLSFGKK